MGSSLACKSSEGSLQQISGLYPRISDLVGHVWELIICHFWQVCSWVNGHGATLWEPLSYTSSFAGQLVSSTSDQIQIYDWNYHVKITNKQI